MKKLPVTDVKPYIRKIKELEKRIKELEKKYE
jgi:tRNA (Thr-GGU) A37 N-methylase